MYVVEVTVQSRWVPDGAGAMSVPSAQSLYVPPATAPTFNARPVTASVAIADQTSQANLNTQLGTAGTTLGTAIAAALIANGVNTTMYSWQSGGPTT